MISVIIPVKEKSQRIVQKFSKENLKEIQILIQEGKQGRGQPIVTGIKKAKHNNILILHADTKLPKNWQELIETTLENHAGGCFGIENEIKTIKMKLIIKQSDILTKLVKEMWGDRAVFFKKSLLNEKDLEKINVPIMEDIILSKVLRKKGKIKILKHKVHSSAKTFNKLGTMRYALRIIKIRIKYVLGIDINKLYNEYYKN